jgi:ABC-type transporter Mla MlaB component
MKRRQPLSQQEQSNKGAYMAHHMSKGVDRRDAARMWEDRRELKESGTEVTVTNVNVLAHGDSDAIVEVYVRELSSGALHTISFEALPELRELLDVFESEDLMSLCGKNAIMWSANGVGIRLLTKQGYWLTVIQ